MWNNLKISKKLVVAFGVQIGVTFAVSALLLFVLLSARQATAWNDHTFQVLAKIERVVTSMVNQETGLRGYLIAGQDAFLAPYKTSEAAADRSLDELQSMTSDNPVQQARIADLRRLVGQWRDEAAKPSVALMAATATQEQARAREAHGIGKAAMDAIRAKAAEMSADESALMAERVAYTAYLQSLAQWTLVGGGLLSIGFALLIGHLFSKTVTAPIARITAAMGRIMAGDLDASVPRTTRQDEVGDLAKTAAAFGDMARELRAEAEASVGREVLEKERQEREAAQAREAADDRHIITELGRGLQALSEGDLAHRIAVPFAEKAARLREDFNVAAAKLTEAMGVIAGSTATIRSGTAEISSAAEDLSRRTEQQAASLEETAAALDEITATVKKTASGAGQARTVVAAAKSDAERSGVVVTQAVAAMSAIERSSSQIGQIIGVIDEIAFQTNLLALNAGVEAARAGEAGRGFAVVASEVRALAQRSAEAAKEIKALISTSATQVGQGVELVGETGKALTRIVGQVAQIATVVTEIAASAQEQSAGLEQVNTAINQMDQVTQQNAAMVEESTAASRNLANETDLLAELVGRFRVEGAAGRPAVRTRRGPQPVQALKSLGRGGAAPKEALQTGTDWAEF